MTSSSVSLPFPGSKYWLYIKKRKKYSMYKLSLFKLAFDIYVSLPPSVLLARGVRTLDF